MANLSSAFDASGRFQADSLDLDGASTIVASHPTIAYSGESPLVSLTASSVTAHTSASQRGGVLDGLLSQEHGATTERGMDRPVRLTFDQVAWDFEMRIEGGEYHDYSAIVDSPTATVEPRDSALLLSGTASRIVVRGNFDLLVKATSLTLQNATDQLQVRASQGGDSAPDGFLRLQLTGARLDMIGNEGFRSLEAASMQLDHTGTAKLGRAYGRLAAGDQSAESAYRDLVLTGTMRFDAKPGDDDGAMRIATAGAIDHVAVGEDAARLTDATSATGLGLIALTALLVSSNHVKVGLIIPLYARISNSQVLSSEARRAVFEFIRRNPGVDVKELARRQGMGWSTAIYHLRVLERGGLIVSERSGRSRRIYENGGDLAAAGAAESTPPEERTAHQRRLRAAVALMRTSNARSLCDAIERNPGLMQKDLAQSARMPVATVSWLVAKLKSAGLVVEEREWRAKRYRLSHLWHELCSLYDEVPEPVAASDPVPLPAGA